MTACIWCAGQGFVRRERRMIACKACAGQTPRKTLQLLSWGGGVQSTAIALLMEQGVIPAPDAIVWADTGDESEAVYEHIARWWPRLQHIAPTYRVQRTGAYPRVSDAVIAKARTGKGSNTLPFFLKDQSGKVSLTRRGCTHNYKIVPLNNLAKRLCRASDAENWRWWLGISTDEMQRMKVDAWHPLIEESDGTWRRPGYSRTACESVIASASETAPRSSCVFCPFRGAHEWRGLTPHERQHVAAMDAEIEAGFKALGKHGALTDRPYLRRDCTPITGDAWFDQVVPTVPGEGMVNECEGGCGL
jgi:hypothetical protein